jgi:hypothetical protein
MIVSMRDARWKQRTYETNAGYCQGTNRMDQRADSSDVDILRRDLEVP